LFFISIKTGYLPQYRKLISYLGTFDVPESKARSKIRELSKESLRSTLENIDNVPDWNHGRERDELMRVNDIYGSDLLLSFVITYEDSMKEMNILERMEFAYPHSIKDTLECVERMSKVPFTGRFTSRHLT